MDTYIVFGWKEWKAGKLFGLIFRRRAEISKIPPCLISGFLQYLLSSKIGVFGEGKGIWNNSTIMTKISLSMLWNLKLKDKKVYQMLKPLSPPSY